MYVENTLLVSIMLVFPGTPDELPLLLVLFPFMTVEVELSEYSIELVVNS